MSTNGNLHLIQANLDMAGLMRLARKRGLPIRAVDLGYTIHCGMRELFGADGPEPFSFKADGGRNISFLGYANASADDLRKIAEACALPQVYKIMDLDKLESKPMPSNWPVGWRLNFEVRACPIRRRGKREKDVFLIHCDHREENAPPINREQVYCDWLNEQFERLGGARIVNSSLIGFQRQKLNRRNQASDRKTKVMELTSAHLGGMLEITDQKAFNELLERGVGRHRSFGFGMLLLRPKGV